MADKKNITRLRGKDKVFYELLMRERARVLGHFNIHKTDILETAIHTETERTGLSTHMADISGDTFQNEIELGRMTAESDVIEMIDEAIERLLMGQYGKCTDCGCIIREERLKAKPYAIRCIDCASKNENMYR